MNDATHRLLQTTRTIDFTTIGARSGRPSRIEIWAWWFEERYIITGTPGRRDWMANIRANPAVIVHVGDHDVPGRAQLVTDEEFRHRFFTNGQASWYSTQSELERLVTRAPMIEIHFD